MQPPFCLLLWLWNVWIKDWIFWCFQVVRSVICLLTSHNQLAICTMQHNWKMRKGHCRDKLRQEFIQQFPRAKKQKGRLNFMTKTVLYLTLPGNACVVNRGWQVTSNRQMLTFHRPVNNRRQKLPQQWKILHLLRWSNPLLALRFAQEEMEDTSDACGQLSKKPHTTTQ